MNQQVIPDLTPAQQDALLQRLRRQRAPSLATALQVAPDAARSAAPFALTDIQQAYWVGRQGSFVMGNVSAHAYIEIDCPDLDLPRLEAAWQKVIARHGMLRAVIDADGRQRMLESVAHYRIATQDLRALSPEAQQEQVAALRAELSHQVLPADRWPLFDIRASRLGDRGYRLHLSLDVLILDAHSFDQVIAPEWAAWYADETLELAPLQFTFADYVHGLQQLQHNDAFTRSLAYWRERLDSLPSAPEFNLAKAPEKITTPQFQHRSARLEAERWQALRAAGGARAVTPANVLLAAYALVIGRWSGSDHFTLNLTLFNRLPFHPEVDRLVGDFTTATLLEVNLRPARSFTDLARAIQQQLWQDLDNQSVTSVRVMRELAEHRRSGPPTFPVVFTGALNKSAQSEPRSVLGWLGEVCNAVTQTPQVWIDCQTVEDAGALVLDWDSVDELFEPGFVDAMFEGFSALVRQLAEQPEAWERQHHHLLPPAQLRLMQQANNTRGPYRSQLLHEPLIAQCRAHPKRLAVADGRRSLSFGELYAESNALAHAIIAQGIPTGSLVAVLLPKCAEQVVAVLGILEAGTAYVPVDPGMPRERIRELLRLSGARALVSDEPTLAATALGDFAPQGDEPPIAVLVLDALKTRLSGAARPLPPLCGHRDLAYVIYTSGSTGVPKGVAIDHRGALNTCDDCNQRFAITPGDRVLGLSALNFDLSVWDIFGVLAAGGALILPQASRAREPAHWAELMRRYEVTVWNTVPALLDLYVGYLRDVAGVTDTRLRLAMMSGDWIALGLPAQIQAQCPNAAVFSLGGATEASIWSILNPIGEVDPAWRSIPYGTPMRNQSFHVRDSHLDHCPVGVPGELCIGGIGVALGYWRDEARTASQFVFCPHSGERLYRTGDLGRWLPNGQLEILGRMDFQVKINGYRVELGEIEASMTAHPEVRQAVAHVSGGTTQARQLVGYYVRDTSASHVDGEREKLAARLARPGIRRSLEGAAVRSLSLSFALPDLANPAPQRRSVRSFSGSCVSAAQLAGLLEPLRLHEINGLAQYAYASAGGFYPVQVYVHVDAGRVQGLSAGLHYFHPALNALQCVDADCVLEPQWFPAANQSIVAGAAFRIFLVASRQAIEPHYGADAVLPLTTLEAGAMSQLMEGAAVAHGLGTVQLGGFQWQQANDLMRMGDDGLFLHMLAGGIPQAVGATDGVQVCSEGNDAGRVLSDAQFESALRAQLSARLPEYMVPRQFIRIAAIPLSANGKVDRRALPEPAQRRTAPLLLADDLPVSPLANEIRAMWEQVLKQPAGLNDNFFELGGTSVDMIRIHSLLSPRLPQPVTVVDMFFTYPTIADLVRFLAPDEGGQAHSSRANSSISPTSSSISGISTTSDSSAAAVNAQANGTRAKNRRGRRPG